MVLSSDLGPNMANFQLSFRFALFTSVTNTQCRDYPSEFRGRHEVEAIAQSLFNVKS